MARKTGTARRNSEPTASNSGTRSAIYARVSTADQHVEQQVVELRALATARGWEVVEVYTDVGISGTRASRPGLDACLADAEAHRFDVLLAWKIDRVGRSLVHLVQVIERLVALNVGFVSLHDPGLDSTTATGMLMLQVCGAFAQYERSLIVERTRAGVARAQAAGKHCGRPRRDLDLRAAHVLLERGESVRTVAAMLNVPRGTLRRRLAEVDQKSDGGDASEVP